MKTIYLLLTKSNSFVSKAIYYMTQDDYTHISISFEESLQPMYSCARKYTYTPLPAGIKNESLISGFYLKNSSIPCALYRIKVTEDKYNKAKALLNKILEDEGDYKYNLMGLVLCHFELAYRRHHYYFCSDFVSEILAHSQILELPKMPSLMKPSDYLLFEELEWLYKGNIHDLVQSRGIS